MQGMDDVIQINFGAPRSSILVQPGWCWSALVGAGWRRLAPVAAGCRRRRLLPPPVCAAAC